MLRATRTRTPGLLVQAVELAAAANPLPRPGVDVVRDAVERWADETAATHIGDRAVVARALAQAAFAKSRNPAPAAPAVLPVAGSAVAARARAMLSPAPRPRRLRAAAIALLALSPALSALGVGHTAEAHFEQARTHCAADADHRCNG